MSNKNSTCGGLSILTIIQIWFLIQHFTDQCVTYPQKECNTFMGKWPLYYVFMPYIIAGGLLCVGCCVGLFLVCASRNVEKKLDLEKYTNYTEP